MIFSTIDLISSSKKKPVSIESIIPRVVPSSYHTKKSAWVGDDSLACSGCPISVVMEELSPLASGGISLRQCCGTLVKLASDQGRSKTGGDGT